LQEEDILMFARFLQELKHRGCDFLTNKALYTNAQMKSKGCASPNGVQNYVTKVTGDVK
jgi:hypothetical protein